MLGGFQNPLPSWVPSQINKSYQFAMDINLPTLLPAMTIPSPRTCLLNLEPVDPHFTFYCLSPTCDLGDDLWSVPPPSIGFKQAHVQRSATIKEPQVLRPFTSLVSVEMAVSELRRISNEADSITMIF